LHGAGCGASLPPREDARRQQSHTHTHSYSGTRVAPDLHCSGERSQAACVQVQTVV
jgi:hypothetical protein